MHARSAMPLAAALMLCAGLAQAQQETTLARLRSAADRAGTWELAFGQRAEACRLLLRAAQSDKGNYFLGMPAACRHAMPSLAKVGRWSLPDATHLTLDEPDGAPVLTLTAAGDGFVGTDGARAYRLTRLGGTGAKATALDAPQGVAAVVPIAQRAVAAEAAVPATRVTADEVAGRYAVMREKRDTGCMVTLDDKTRGKVGGDHAQLAPGCRDQGIVIFDPVGWRLVKGALVLTARAGHTAKLDKVGEANWAKDVKDGSKPLGLKKL